MERRPRDRRGHHARSTDGDGGRPLEDPVRTFVGTCRSAILATLAPSGRSRLVPICFVLDDDGAILYTPLDEKPKRSADPYALARVRDIRRQPAVTLLFERWSEDWSLLAWVRVYGRAALLEPDAGYPDHRSAVASLRAKYPQYGGHRLERLPLLRIALVQVRVWSASAELSR